MAPSSFRPPESSGRASAIILTSAELRPVRRVDLIVTLAAWMIGLGEAFQSTHLVPSSFIYLIFWSCVLVSLIAMLAGVVIGYRRS